MSNSASIQNQVSAENSLLTNIYNEATVGAFKLASFLTEPACLVREHYQQMRVLEGMFVQKIWLFFQIIICTIQALFASVPSIAIRSAATFFQKEPYIYRQGDLDCKQLSDKNSFTLLSWNICCVSGGYSITDGGVIPWQERIDKIIDKIKEKDADVLALYETFDLDSSFYLYDHLKNSYAHFYFNIGPKSVGVSSGIFVASKYEIDNPSFIPFSQKSLVGRTKNCKKGIFSFDLKSSRSFATLLISHLQHSEEPQRATAEEIKSRCSQMDAILQHAKQRYSDRCLIVAGDLNLDDAEFAQLPLQEFSRGTRDFKEHKTWGGDSFCAALEGKEGSKALNLDHTMMLKETTAGLQSFLVESGFDAKHYHPDALSDHHGIYSKIILKDY